MKRINKWNTVICLLTFAACTVPSISMATPFPETFKNNSPAVFQVINSVKGTKYSENEDLKALYVADDDYWSDLTWWEVASTSAGNTNQLGIVSAGAYQPVSTPVTGSEIFNAGSYNDGFISTGTFEFALSTNGARYYSDPLHNTSDSLLDHMLTFSLGAFDYGGHSYKNGYLLAWEDIRIGSSDKDYNDITFLVDANPAPVPEPATMLLFGTGLAGLAGARIRKKKK